MSFQIQSRGMGDEEFRYQCPFNFATVTEWKLSSSLYPGFSQNVQRPEYEKSKEKRDSKLQIMALVQSQILCGCRETRRVRVMEHCSRGSVAQASAEKKDLKNRFYKPQFWLISMRKFMYLHPRYILCHYKIVCVLYVLLSHTHHRMLQLKHS